MDTNKIMDDLALHIAPKVEQQSTVGERLDTVYQSIDLLPYSYGETLKSDIKNIKLSITNIVQLAEQKVREETLEKYNKYLFEKGFVDDDIFNESPIEEFLSTK